ncbi:MAG: NADH-quinone oxidoreductase subunit C [Paludibacteraceae bacterium]|nr:NADH-quinone oxidoreductase subunit C [Paludibacteraceae bacterium]MBR4840146.1 NADH-quinone oxidoreductase subunit C [Paludibacteraceae bacterium]
MEKIQEYIHKLAPKAQFEEGGKYTTAIVEANDLRKVAAGLKEKGFDYLMCLTGMDNQDSFGVIYHISSSKEKKEVIVLKTNTTNREEPTIPTVSDIWEIANYYEREAYDFYGIIFVGHPDMRRLFLREDWVGYPFRKDFVADESINPIPTKVPEPDDYETVPSYTINKDGKLERKVKSLFENKDCIVNIGPQHPSTHGVLHLRTKLEGEIIKKIDPQFGYIHRGIEKMCESMTYPQMLYLTERLDYLCGTMNRHALCMCVEKAAGIEVPARAQYIRTIFDELTRIASHLIGWACMCNDMGSITAFIYGMRDREKIMDIYEETAGGRLMVNYYVVGGVAQDIHPNFVNRVKEFIPYMRKMLKEYHILFTGNPIAAGRMKDSGFLTKEQAVALGVTGPSGRASGWSCDVRKIEPYAAYDKVKFDEITYNEMMSKGGNDYGRDNVLLGGTFARYMVRLVEIEESLRIIEQLIDNIPEGDFRAKVPAIIKLPAGEYYQRVENARGDFSVYIKSTGDKNPYRVKFRSPCLSLVTALDPMCRDQKIADLIMISGSLDYVIPCIDR